jgi:ribosomal protein L11 methyltransferase
MSPPSVHAFLMERVLESTRSLTPTELISDLTCHLGLTRLDAKACLNLCVTGNHLAYRQVLGRTVVVPSLNRYHGLAPGVVLKPPHLPPDPDTTHCITMKEGISFGNGTHATTRLCAELMMACSGSGGCWHSSLDLGTGTGVLSLLAVKLGVHRGDATDIDPIALHDARENALLNECSHLLAFHHADAFASTETYPLVVANLRSPTLISFHEDITRWTAGQADLILSGIREGEEDRVISFYAPHFDVKSAKMSKGWVGLHLKKSIVC